MDKRKISYYFSEESRPTETYRVSFVSKAKYTNQDISPDVQAEINKALNDSMNQAIDNALFFGGKLKTKVEHTDVHAKDDTIFKLPAISFGLSTGDLTLEAWEKMLAIVDPFQRFKNDTIAWLKENGVSGENIERCLIAIRSEKFRERYTRLSDSQWREPETVFNFLFNIYKEITNG